MNSSMRREAMIVGIMWCCAATYTIGYCGTFGYGRSFDDLKFIWGFPDWVFWGVAVPWSVCLAASVVFAMIMKDDELERDLSGKNHAAGREESENA